jgi:hypothetical protein
VEKWGVESRGKAMGDENHYAPDACKRQSICVTPAGKVKPFVGWPAQ